MFGGSIGSGFYFLKHSEAYLLGVSTLQANPIATTVLGTPIKTGFPFGTISYQGGGTGAAVLSFSASGPKAKGKVFLEAIRKDEVWSIRRLTLKIEGSNRAIDIVNGAANNST